MNHYRKGPNVEEELTKDAIPIENLQENFLWMHVRGGTKVGNVIEFARKALDNKECRQVVWSGSGGEYSFVFFLLLTNLLMLFF